MASLADEVADDGGHWRTTYASRLRRARTHRGGAGWDERFWAEHLAGASG